MIDKKRSIITKFSKSNIIVNKEYKQKDGRFLDVSIYILHLGENYNGSYFSKEVVDKALPTLANTPILGYIEDGDYSDHRTEIEKTDNKLIWKYKGSAFGVIPETNNARYIEREDKDGLLRTYLVVDGVMWTKWDEPIELMLEKGFKSQSMELTENYTGEFKDDNLFHFDTFEFFGACLLGDSVYPAMEGSTVEVDFSQNIKENILGQLNKYYEVKENSKTKENNKKNERRNNMENFSLSIEQIKDALWDLLNPIGEDGCRNYRAWISSTYPEKQEIIVNYEDDTNANYKRHKYEVSESGDVSIDDGIIIFAEFLTQEEKDDLEKRRLLLEANEKELKDLKENFSAKEQEFIDKEKELEDMKVEFNKIKSDYDVIKPQFDLINEEKVLEEKQEIIDSFTLLNDEDKKDCLDNIKEFSKEEIENKLFVILKNKQNEISTMMSKISNTENPIVGLPSAERKIPKTDFTKPAYAGLFEEEK